jgi:modified peptide precursor CbpA
MVKDSDGRESVRRGPFFVVWRLQERKRTKGRTMKTTQKPKKKTVTACRKKCQPKGTGLSHYILMDKKAKK